MRMLLAGVILAGSLAACGTTQPFDACKIQPTRMSTPEDEGYPDVWVEHDGERIDADPCDSDDFVVNGKGHLVSKKPDKPKPTTKPTTKSTKRS